MKEIEHRFDYEYSDYQIRIVQKKNNYHEIIYANWVDYSGKWVYYREIQMETNVTRYRRIKKENIVQMEVIHSAVEIDIVKPKEKFRNIFLNKDYLKSNCTLLIYIRLVSGVTKKYQATWADIDQGERTEWLLIRQRNTQEYKRIKLDNIFSIVIQKEEGELCEPKK